MKKFSIGYRTLKTAFGASVAIAIAQYFDLQFFTAAGILTILCIQPTKRKSVHAVYTRIVSTFVRYLCIYIFRNIRLFIEFVFGDCAHSIYSYDCFAWGCRRICFKCGHYDAHLFYQQILRLIYCSMSYY